MRRRNIQAAISSDANTGEIDLTPMLDVVFIMLIFFIVTATFIKEPGIEVTRPEAISAEMIKNQKILIAINQDDEVWIDKKKIDQRSLASVIERLHVENPKGAVVVQVDEKSTAEAFALVSDAAKSAGVEFISVATSEK